MNKIRVLVVDDSLFMRRILSDIVNSHSEIEVIDVAKNGEEAIYKIKNLKPDVVTLDVEMPKMDGLSALQKIMDIHPVPVIMLSSLTQEGTDATIKALHYGAVDFIAKPSNIFRIKVEDMKKQLIDKILVASKIKLRKKNFYKSLDPMKVEKENSYKSKALVRKNVELKKIVAIGTSTGGPRALQTVLSNIPKDIDAAFVIVQHMPPGFTKSLAARLDSICDINVKEAQQGDILMPGNAYIAPGGYHMLVNKKDNKFVIELNNSEPISGHRPSVDVMMNSLADLCIDNIIGVILTGMGSDGARGLKEIKKNSGYIIAQDEESCVVFGMPKSTINFGIVDKVLPIDDISDEIIKAVGV